MAHRSFVLILVISLVLTACGGPATSAPPETASLSELQGTVEIKNPDQAGFAAASAADTLRLQGQVRTGEDGRVRLDISSGSILRIAPSSLFTLTSNSNSSGSWLTGIKLESGRIWISLRGGRIDVETPSGMASVRGSYLTVWVDPLTEDTWVSCLEGWCVADNPSGSLEMIAGQGTILYAWDPAGSVPPPPPMLRYLTQQEIDDFLQNNPELGDVMQSIIATASALPPLPVTSTPQVLPTPTLVDACFSLVAPAEGAVLPDGGPVSFTWTQQAGAQSYTFTIVTPGGDEIILPTAVNSYEKDMALLPGGGVYNWMVSAYDAGLNLLCTTDWRTFTKPALPTPVPTETPSFTCVNLVQPADGASLPAVAAVDFTWTEYPDAAKYIVTFIQPSKVPITFLSTTNSLSRYIESFYAAGTYTWTVTVKDANNREICTSAPFTFTKPGSEAVVPTSKPASTSVPGNTATVFSNISGPASPEYSCSPYFQVTATDPDGVSVVKVQYKIYDGSGIYVSESYKVLPTVSGSTWTGNVYIPGVFQTYQVVWWFWAIDGSGNNTYSGPSNYTYQGSTSCP